MTDDSGNANALSWINIVKTASNPDKYQIQVQARAHAEATYKLKLKIQSVEYPTVTAEVPFNVILSGECPVTQLKDPSGASIANQVYIVSASAVASTVALFEHDQGVCKYPETPTLDPGASNYSWLTQNSFAFTIDSTSSTLMSELFTFKYQGTISPAAGILTSPITTFTITILQK